MLSPLLCNNNIPLKFSFSVLKALNVLERLELQAYLLAWIFDPIWLMHKKFCSKLIQRQSQLNNLLPVSMYLTQIHQNLKQNKANFHYRLFINICCASEILPANYSIPAYNNTASYRYNEYIYPVLYAKINKPLIISCCYFGRSDFVSLESPCILRICIICLKATNFQ